MTRTETADANDIITYLETITRAHALWHRKADAPAWQRPIESLILEIGQIWTPQQLLRGVRPGPPKQCFASARQLVRRRTALRYAEGFALGPESPLPVPHAWAVTGDDEVVDPTWVDPEHSAYYGVVIPLPSLQAMIAAAGQEGFFGSDYRVGFPTLKLGRIPTTEEIQAAAEAHRRAQRAALGRVGPGSRLRSPDAS
jgi:hypothetical protein